MSNIPNRKKRCIRSKPTDKIGKPKEIAKAVHHYLDWVRACKARKDDKRGFDVERILELCQEGYELTDCFDTHYLGD